MSNHSGRSKRLALNTLFLYARMLLLMFITLFTSRVTLRELGVDDYGIYNVVGGVVAMFSLLSGSLSAAISRFLTYELGKGNKDRIKKVFSTSINIQVILILIIVLLLETIGLWFINCKLVIPADRITAANWVYQFSVATFAINLWSIPYNAAIIAHEKLSAFAYISIFEATAKLLIAYLLVISLFDKLIFYGLLIMLVGFSVRFIYGFYCKRNFEECRYEFVFDKGLTKEMFGFAGWNFIGASSAVLRDQGGNILINIFFGPTVNAARAVSMQVNHAVNGFVKNFMVALNPQITKSYATGDYDYLFKLIFQGARFSFYILLFLSLPIMVTTPYLMQLWLEQVPNHAINFVRLILIFTMCESLSGPMATVMLATGRIRNYQIVIGGLQLLNIPISYTLLKFGMPPEIIFIVAIFISLCCDIARLFMLRKYVNLSIGSYIRSVYLNAFSVTFVALIIPLLLLHFNPIYNFSSFAITVFVSVISTTIVLYTIGCSKEDRLVVKKIMSKIIHHKL